MKTFIFYVSTLLFSSGLIHAQDVTDSQRQEELAHARKDRYLKRSTQIGFITPLSTNGLEGRNVSNHVSLNALGSYAAALDGVEVSGLFNIEKDYVKGAQFSGIFNAVGHEVDGVQFSGLGNLAGGPVFGAQFSGIVNAVGDAVQGTQLAGIVNTVTGDVQGIQVAGIINVTRGAVKGFQLAGIVNVGKHIKGIQLGLVNVADTIEGAQIGLINLTRHGYRRFEIGTGEVLHGTVAFRMGGNERFYNILTAGAAWPTTNRTRWGYGFGFGTNQPLTKRNRIAVEAIAYHILETGNRYAPLNMLNQARVSFIFPLQNKLALTVTPTFNVQVSQLKNSNSSEIGPKWVDWNVYDKLVNDHTRIRMWPGLNLGLQF